jgi:predicted Zn-dependent peptidase
LGFRGYNSNNPKKYAQELLAIALGGMMSSRMFLKIREEMGLAYYIRTAVDENPDTGCILTRAGLDNKRIEPAIKAIVEEYRKIREEGISEDELKKAKDNVIGHMTLSMESSDALASYYGMQELLEEKIETPEEYYEMIKKVTPEDIQAVAKDLFLPEKMNLAIVGPYKDKSQFEKILNI